MAAPIKKHLCTVISGKAARDVICVGAGRPSEFGERRIAGDFLRRRRQTRRICVGLLNDKVLEGVIGRRTDTLQICDAFFISTIFGGFER
jgi:hypothetical protein